MFEANSEGAPAAAGGGLHACLDEVDVAAADADTCLDALADYERVIAAAAARQHELLARLDELRGVSRDDWIREEVAAALGLAPDTARDRLSLARTLVHRLADTWRLLREGVLTPLHARVLASAIQEHRLSAEQTARVQEWVLRKPDLPVGRFAARVRYAVKKFAPVPAERARAVAREGRYAWHKPDGREVGTLVIHGPAEATAVAWAFIDDHAHRAQAPGDQRTIGQRRFDAFTDLFLGQQAWESVRAHVDVTVPVDTLRGGSTPGELAGYGPISASTARKLATLPTARWRRLVVDPATGFLVSCSRHTYAPNQPERLLTDPVEPPPAAVLGYRPSAALARYVRALYRCCVFPGCGRKARRVDLDHVRAWCAGGTTSSYNLVPLCPRHHKLKHESGWRLTRYADGSVIWTSPAGRSYTVWPHDYRGP